MTTEEEKKKRREYQRQYYATHQEQAREYQRLYNLAHKKTFRKPRADCPYFRMRKRGFTAYDIMQANPERAARMINRVLRGVENLVI